VTSTDQVPVVANPIPQAAASVGVRAAVPTKQITAIQANVRLAPSMSGSVVRTLTKGVVVHVLQSESGWIRVADENGEPLGWVHGSLLK
jgi:SH3-like domain-containing protein